MKDCKKIHPLLALHAEEALSPAEAKKVEVHLASCADARRELEEYQRLHKTLIAWPEPPLPKDLHEKIMGRVTGKLKPLRPHKPFWPFPAGLAAAACLVLYLVVQNPELTRFDQAKVATNAPVQAVSPAPGLMNRTQAIVAAKASKPSTTHLDKLKEIPKDAHYAPEPAPAQVTEKNGQVTALGVTPPSMEKKAHKAMASQPAPRVAEQNEMAFNNAPSASSGAAPAPTPVPTEGSMADIAFSKKITASSWSGVSVRAPIGGQLMTDPSDFTTMWQALRPAEAVPAVDFTTQAVILLSESRPLPGSQIKVNQIEEEDGQLVVHYQVEQLTPFVGIGASAISTNIWTLQVIPKPSKPVVFQKD